MFKGIQISVPHRWCTVITWSCCWTSLGSCFWTSCRRDHRSGRSNDVSITVLKQRLNVLTKRSLLSFNKHIHKPANPGHATEGQRRQPMHTQEGWGGGEWGGVSCLWLSLSGSPPSPRVRVVVLISQSALTHSRLYVRLRVHKYPDSCQSAATDAASDACSPKHRCYTLLSGLHVLSCALSVLRLSAWCLSELSSDWSWRSSELNLQTQKLWGLLLQATEGARAFAEEEKKEREMLQRKGNNLSPGNSSAAARRGREGEGGSSAVDIRIRIIIQLKGYSPPHSLKGGDEHLQAYHSSA